MFPNNIFSDFGKSIGNLFNKPISENTEKKENELQNKTDAATQNKLPKVQPDPQAEEFKTINAKFTKDVSDSKYNVTEKDIYKLYEENIKDSHEETLNILKDNDIANLNNFDKIKKFIDEIDKDNRGTS